MLAGPWWVGAVARRRGVGRPVVARKTIGVLWLGSYGLFSTKKKHKTVNTKFWQHLPYTVRFPKPTRKPTARWPTCTYI